MIDVNSGDIIFDDSSFNAQTQLAEMEATPGAKITPCLSGRTQLSMGSRSFKDSSWGVGLVFSYEKLSQIWLQCLSADGVDAKAWSLENEKLRKVTHDLVVNRLCSSSSTAVKSASSLTYKFSWGTISSTLDVRGVQALVLVEYLQA